MCIEFNENLKFGLFNSNDLKMIQEDKNKTFNIRKRGDEIETTAEKINFFDQTYKAHKESGKRLPLLLESIFLRYLPVPFIKFLYEMRERYFLEVYRMQNYRSPILIWSSELRKHLEDKIKSNATDFLGKLRDFASDPELIKQPE